MYASVLFHDLRTCILGHAIRFGKWDSKERELLASCNVRMLYMSVDRKYL